MSVAEMLIATDVHCVALGHPAKYHNIAEHAWLPDVATPNFNGNKILQGLGHLAALNGQMAGVEEIVHPLIILVERL